MPQGVKFCVKFCVKFVSNCVLNARACQMDGGRGLGHKTRVPNA